jgi:hypothetical protein
LFDHSQHVTLEKNKINQWLAIFFEGNLTVFVNNKTAKKFGSLFGLFFVKIGPDFTGTVDYFSALLLFCGGNFRPPWQQC